MKNRLAFFFACLVSAVVGYAADSQGISYLSALGPKLKEARALPVGAVTAFRCPADLQQFKGVPVSAVLSSLSVADYQAGNQFSYFLTAPVPPDQRGGGFPELTFFSSPSGTIEHATCAYSK